MKVGPKTEKALFFIEKTIDTSDDAELVDALKYLKKVLLNYFSIASAYQELEKLFNK